LVSIGIAHEKLADYAAATLALQEALELARAVPDAQTESQVLSELSWIALRKGEYPQAEALGQRALELAQQAGDKLASADAGSRLGILAFYRGDYPGGPALPRGTAAIPGGRGPLPDRREPQQPGAGRHLPRRLRGGHPLFRGSIGYRPGPR
jgi:tetratricopeptide (TPR) repeat protein